MNFRASPESSPQKHLPVGTETGSGPNCWHCEYFGVTHIPATPYSCKLMGFRSKTLPALQVLQVDGHFCLGFRPKTDRKGQATSN